MWATKHQDLLCKLTWVGSDSLCVSLPVSERVQHMMGSRTLVEPRVFASLFKLTLAPLALLLSWLLEQVINPPKVF